jgi:DNA-directed RNA polymerase specialized sigma24 family protein
LARDAKEDGLPSLSRIFGYIAVKELNRLQDRVEVLARLGFPNKEIAIICGTSSDSVATLKNLARRSRK